MFTTPNFANCFAIRAGWHRLAPPTLTARRNTTQAITKLEGGIKNQQVREEVRTRKF
jgi:hypothetical protein